ncbi:hypothetical protein [Streptomyces sp. NPDC004546]|uniref:hypothetical protein n=1 Tax=Streptomyces sp. NPDC004546 TaxID=3154282 RepID=UPI0033A66127
MKKKVAAALRRGRGFAVLRVEELLLGPEEEFAFLGDEHEQFEVRVALSYRAGRMGVEFHPPRLPSSPADSVLVYQATPAGGEPLPVVALLEAIGRMQSAAGNTENAQAATAAAEAARALLPTRRSTKK